MCRLGRPFASPEQMAALSGIVEAGPDPAVDPVVRWRRVDLRRGIRERFGVELHERTVGKLLHRLGFARLSVRPKPPKSDPTGQFEVTLFSEALEAGRPHLEPGSRVVIQVEATSEGDQLRLTGRTVTPVEEIVANLGSAGLRVFVDAEGAFASVARVLDQARAAARRAKGGPVTLLLLHPSLPGEVEIDLGDQFPVTTEIRRALRSVPGVLEVEEP